MGMRTSAQAFGALRFANAPYAG